MAKSLLVRIAVPVGSAIALTAVSTVFEKTVLPKFPIEKLFQKEKAETEDPIVKAARDVGL